MILSDNYCGVFHGSIWERSNKIKIIWQNRQHFHVIALPAFEWVILSKLSQHHKTRCFPMKHLEEIGVKFWLMGVQGGNVKTELKAITLVNRPFCTRLCCKHSIQGCQISQHIDFIHDQNSPFRLRESSYHSVEVFGSSLSSPSKSLSWSVRQHLVHAIQLKLSRSL